MLGQALETHLPCVRAYSLAHDVQLLDPGPLQLAHCESHTAHVALVPVEVLHGNDVYSFAKQLQLTATQDPFTNTSGATHDVHTSLEPLHVAQVLLQLAHSAVRGTVETHDVARY